MSNAAAERDKPAISAALIRISRPTPNPMATSFRAARLNVREKVVQVISGYNHEAVIAEYIRTKGVTRCPTACVVPTQASVDEADRAALEEYAAERARQRREKAAARARLFWTVDLSGSSSTR